MLELKNITKTFGSVVANNDVSINIKKARFTRLSARTAQRNIQDKPCVQLKI